LAFEAVGSTVTIIIVILIISGLVYSFWRKAYISMSLAIVNFIIFFVWRLTVEATSTTVLIGVLDDLSLRYFYFTDNPIKLYTLFTHMYMHFDIMHVIFNMIFLVLFGVPFEERVGMKAFALIYFISGTAASVIDAGFSINYYSSSIGQLLGTNPLIAHIGASGAIFGIMGAFFVLYPRDKVFLPVGIIAMHIPVYIAVLAFAAFETILAFANPDDNIGHMVHVMGFFSGAMLAIIFGKYIKSDERATIGKEIDLNALKKLATNNELRDLFLKFKDEDEPEIRKAWLEKFVESASCPKCKSSLKLKGRKIRCNCGYNMKF
jgi:membrane associated rhomboid family serine protease